MSEAYEVYDKNHPKNKDAEKYMEEQYKKLGIPWRPKKAKKVSPRNKKINDTNIV